MSYAFIKWLLLRLIDLQFFVIRKSCFRMHLKLRTLAFQIQLKPWLHKTSWPIIEDCAIAIWVVSFFIFSFHPNNQIMTTFYRMCLPWHMLIQQFNGYTRRKLLINSFIWFLCSFQFVYGIDLENILLRLILTNIYVICNIIFLPYFKHDII